MSWFRIDDGFYAHPKVVALRSGRHGKGAIALWSMAGSWCSQQLTDGHVPRAVVTMLGGSQAEAEALVESGLWVRTDEGYAFHDWLDRNPSRARIEEKREQQRQRVTRHRDKRAGNALHDASETQGVTPPPSRPVPTRPDPPSLRSGGGAGAPGATPPPRPAPVLEHPGIASIAESVWQAGLVSRGGHPVMRSSDAPHFRAVAEAADALRGEEPLRAVLERWWAEWVATRRSARLRPEWWAEWAQERAAAGAGVTSGWAPPRPAGSYGVTSPEELERMLGPVTDEDLERIERGRGVHG